MLDTDALVKAIVQNVDAELTGLPELVANLELMRRLDVLKPWLEARVERGSTSVVVHTALAKVYVDESAADQFISTSNVRAQPSNCVVTIYSFRCCSFTMPPKSEDTARNATRTSPSWSTDARQWTTTSSV